MITDKDGLPDPREGRLPQWAQALLRRLRANVRSLGAEVLELRQQLQAFKDGSGLPDSDTFMELGDELSDGVMGIGKHTMITFKLKDGTQLDIRTMPSGGLEIEGTGRNGISVVPMDIRRIQIFSTGGGDS